MIVEVLDEQVHEPWIVRLGVSDYRPARRFVTVERVDERSMVHGGCVGFSDDHAEASRLFDAVTRAVAVATGGEPHHVDWAEIPDGMDID